MAAMRDCQAMLLTEWGSPTGEVDQLDGVVGEQRVLPSGDRQVVLDVAGGLLLRHRRHLVTDRDPLVQGRQDAVLHPFRSVG